MRKRLFNEDELKAIAQRYILNKCSASDISISSFITTEKGGEPVQELKGEYRIGTSVLGKQRGKMPDQSPIYDTALAWNCFSFQLQIDTKGKVVGFSPVFTRCERNDPVSDASKPNNVVHRTNVSSSNIVDDSLNNMADRSLKQAKTRLYNNLADQIGKKNRGSVADFPGMPPRKI